ncbi:hypothetical protein OROMI_003302 [Orobanche minor]
MATLLQVISSSLVPMATNENPMSRMELTPWDLQLILVGPIQKGILFHKPELEKTTDIINHLKASLSRTLEFFPPLAGRLGTVADHDSHTTVYFVDCNNKGAEFTHAVAPTLLAHDISEAKYIPKIVSSFFPLNGVRNFQGTSEPLMGVQITELADGLFIGCTANHAVVDGTSFWHFIKSWSEISRGFDKISETPVFERDLLKWENRAIGLPTFNENLLPMPVPRPLLERVFHFSRESVAKLKAKANSEAGTSDLISSLQALLAHLWLSVTRCRRISSAHNNHKSDDNGREIELALPVGVRARIPLPEFYFGNAIYISIFSISETELLRNGLGQTGLEINGFVKQQTSEAAVFGFIEDFVRNPNAFTSFNSTFLVSSSPRYDVYGNDFGWGKPIAVRSGKGQKTDGKMTLFPAAEPGGIDVEVCLAPETMEALGDDAEFMDAVTTSN